MTDREALKKMREYNDFVEEVSKTIDEYLDYLKFPHKKEEVFDRFIKDEESKIDFIDEVEKIIFPVKDKLVLDAGCGKGAVLVSCALRGAKVFGIDTDEEELKIANLRMEKLGLSDSVSIKKASLTNLPFTDNFFDLITCSSVLEHIENTDEAVKEMARVLKPGGFCCIGGPNPSFPREGHYKIFWPPYLPKKIGALYLSIRGFNPDFFIKDVYYVSASKLMEILKSYGFEANNVIENNILFKLRNPHLLKNTKVKRIAEILEKIKLNNFLAKAIISLKFYSHILIVAKKKSEDGSSSSDINLYDKIDPELYDDRYIRVPREIYLNEHWQPIREDMIKKYCIGKKVLDLGSGTGFYIGQIKKNANEVIGLDVSERMLDYAQKKYPGIKFMKADAHKLPFAPKSMEVVFSMGLFEYIDRKVVIKEIYRVLKFGGIAIISVPNRHSLSRMSVRLFHKLTGEKYIPNEPTFKEMINLFSENGFKIMELKMDDGLIWFPNFLDRLIGIKTYRFIEALFKIFRRNPFSTNMLFVVKKY